MQWPKAALVGAALFALAVGATRTVGAQELGGSSYPGPYYIGAPGAPVVIQEYADFQ